jgi:uncharacterized phage-associated protein
MKSINALTLAGYILGKYSDKNITPMKLQKLAYYSKVWTLVAGQPVLSGQFVKWEYGPVNKQIYHHYKKFGGSVIPAEEQGNVGESWEQNELLMFILDNYINLSAYELSTMTHSEDPWITTPKGAIISDNLIIDYYSKQSFAKNFSKASLKNGPFHLLQNENWHSFTLDMNVDEVMDFESYSSYDDFLKQSQNAEFESQEFFKEVFD